MISKESLANLGLGKILGAAWIFFTTVYFFLTMVAPYLILQVQGNLINNAVNTQLNTVFQKGQENGQNIGYQSAYAQLGQALGAQFQGGCKEPIPVNLGSGTTVGIISMNCLQQAAAQQPASPR
jgi:hypothetical protein